MVGDWGRVDKEEDKPEMQIPWPEGEMEEGTEVFFAAPGKTPTSYGRFTSNRWTTGASTRPKKVADSPVTPQSRSYPEKACLWCGRRGHFAGECTQEVDIYNVHKGRNPRFGERRKPKFQKDRVRQMSDESHSLEEDAEPIQCRHLTTLWAIDDNDFDQWHQGDCCDPWSMHILGRNQYGPLLDDDESECDVEVDDDEGPEEVCRLCMEIGIYNQQIDINYMPQVILGDLVRT